MFLFVFALSIMPVGSTLSIKLGVASTNHCLGNGSIVDPGYDRTRLGDNVHRTSRGFGVFNQDIGWKVRIVRDHNRAKQLRPKMTMEANHFLRHVFMNFKGEAVTWSQFR